MRRCFSRDELVRFLETENVLARRYFYPGCHHMQPYASLEPRASLRLVNTERLTKCVMALPNGTAVNVQVVGKICALLRTAQENASMVREGLAQLLSKVQQAAGLTLHRPSVRVPRAGKGGTDHGHNVKSMIRRFFSLVGNPARPACRGRVRRFNAVIQGIAVFAIQTSSGWNYLSGSPSSAACRSIRNCWTISRSGRPARPSRRNRW